jgi:hypothetical protein
MSGRQNALVKNTLPKCISVDENMKQGTIHIEVNPSDPFLHKQ